MRLYCAQEQTDAQGNEVTYSGTQNPLSVKMRGQTFGFVLSQECQCHEFFCHTVRLLLIFHRQRQAGRER